MSKKNILITLSFIVTSISADALRQQLDDLCAYDGQKTFLLSFPRSGNTWLRYCLEFLTQRPSFSRIGMYYSKQRPLGWAAGFDIDLQKAPIEKVHAKHEIKSRPGDRLIFLIRNPKETVARSAHHTFKSVLHDHLAGLGYGGKSYFENFDVYNSWPAADRLVVYYEDLLRYPRETLTTILLFLHEPLDCIELFMSNFTQHQEACKKIYLRTKSAGDLLYHSKKLSSEYRAQVDRWIADAYPEFWNGYLRHRYAEKSTIS